MVDKLKIINCGNYFTVINLKGEHENHAHVKRKSTAELLCKLIKRKRVPRSKYLRESAIRISIDINYVNKVKRKIEKDREKRRYCNSQKGVRR